MKFKILGTEIYISFLFVAVISIMLATDRTGLLLPSLFAVFIHEGAHLFAMWVIDCSPKRIKLIPASIQITRKFGISSKREVFVAVCGPLANFLLFAVLYINYISFGNEMTLYYAMINLLVGAFNMLPVIGLDGGTILIELLSKHLEYERAVKLMKFITFFVFLISLTLGVLLLIKGKFNLSLFILSLYFLLMALLKM